MISCTINKRFEHIQIKQHASEIAEQISRLIGRQVGFSITLVESQVRNEAKKLPVQVEILRDTFKGTLIRSI